MEVAPLREARRVSSNAFYFTYINDQTDIVIIEKSKKTEEANEAEKKGSGGGAGGGKHPLYFTHCA